MILSLPDSFGSLRYSCCKYTDEDGRLVAAAQDYSVNTWKIDYDLFKSTIEGILGTETKQPTTEAIEETVPFDDFFGREITVSSDYHIATGELLFRAEAPGKSAASRSALPKNPCCC